MLPPVHGVVGLRLAVMALALGIWSHFEWPAMAQGGGVGQVGGRVGVPGGPRTPADYGYGGPSYNAPGVPSGTDAAPPGVAGYGRVVYVGQAPGYGTFGPGYPGFGLEYVHGCALRYHHRQFPGEPSLRNWGSYLLGEECLYPYVADPYSDPAAGLGFWPPYSAPVAGPGNMAGR